MPADKRIEPWTTNWPNELAELCTDCNQPPGEMCVCLPVSGVDPDFVRYRSERMQARMALVGTPTKRPHNARYNTARIRQLRRHQLLERRRQAALNAPKPVSTDTLDAMRALDAFDRHEHRQLRDWLAQHATVLIEAGCAQTATTTIAEGQ